MRLGALAEDCSENAGIFRLRDGERGLDALGQQLRGRAGVFQCARPMASILLEHGPVAIEHALGDAEIGLGLGEAGFRLRKVGIRHLANLVASLRGQKLFLQHPHPVLAQVHDGLVAHDVHVGGGRVEKHGDFGRA